MSPSSLPAALVPEPTPNCYIVRDADGQQFPCKGRQVPAAQFNASTSSTGWKAMCTGGIPDVHAQSDRSPGVAFRGSAITCRSPNISFHGHAFAPAALERKR
jgi:hypothetical protein